MGDPHGTEAGKGKRFECQRCGRCCSVRDRGFGFVHLTERDVSTMSAFLELEPKEFNERHCGTTDGILHLRDPQRDCQFLEDEGCAVYEARPLLCRSWPFWPKNLAGEATWEKETANCPGVGKGKLYTSEEIAAIGAAIDQCGPVFVQQPPGDYRVGFTIGPVMTLKLEECPQCRRQFNSAHPKLIELGEKAKRIGGYLPPIQCQGCGSKITPEARLIETGSQIIQ
jgi:Fe-S-cluster containining protein